MRLWMPLCVASCMLVFSVSLGCSGVASNPKSSAYDGHRGTGGLPLNAYSAAETASPAAADAPAEYLTHDKSGGRDAGKGTVNSPQDLEHFALDRYQIKQATVVLEAEDVADALDSAIEDVRQYGGYVLTSDETLTVDKERKATMTVRVPSSEFEPMLRSLAALGTVLQRKVTSDDVTEEYVDLESDLTSQRVIEERVAGYLKKAANLEEMRRLQGELDAIRADINRIQGRLRFLKTRTAFSTIDLTIQPTAIAAPPTPTPSYSFEKVYNDALRDQFAWLQRESDGLVRTALWWAFRVPYLLFWGLLIWGSIRLWKLAVSPRIPAAKAALNRPIM